MGEIAIWIGLLACAVAALRVVTLCRSRNREAGWLPADLGAATIAYAERKFTTETPFQLVAKVDRLYRYKNRLHLMELKTRRIDAIYPSDIIELSAQRMAVEGELGRAVEEIGTVVIDNGKTKVARRVFLLSHQRVSELAARRAGILNGTVAPRYAETRRLCDRCTFHGRECTPPH